MLTSEDRLLLAEKKITEAQLDRQLQRFATGFPRLEVKSSATAGHGIRVITGDDQARYATTWDDYRRARRKIVKFVPASGAASRMFKDLFAFLDAPYDTPRTGFEKTFFAGIEKFAFLDPLNRSLLRRCGQDARALVACGKYKTVAANLLGSDGLNFGSLPKGLLPFHSCPGGYRTALEEHLTEGALYACDSDGEVHLHLTVSPEHRTLFENLVSEKYPLYARTYNVHYRVDFSIQSPSTDTVAVDAGNRPLRNERGALEFRPGGHGALIANLDAIDADVIFIKNIDNVAPDHLREPTVRYKKVLAGILVDLRRRIDNYLVLIRNGSYTTAQVQEMIHFLQDELCIRNPETKWLEDAELILYIRRKLLRPLRVCGMVRNYGEPGGGPFFAVNPDGTVSLQILESSQIDASTPAGKALFDQATHFNPVDIVCATKAYDGTRYGLAGFVDENTGFISHKSKGGHELKALELPGLWNGAMSDWNTVFVEVPAETFSPVKTVNDLLRPEHQ
ncbi:MAG: DUF4301 family protein [Tannerella sp.]|jgi:hypothetical protein|nr:DUF4301 family protein [Tannerella sp.]